MTKQEGNITEVWECSACEMRFGSEQNRPEPWRCPQCGSSWIKREDEEEHSYERGDGTFVGDFSTTQLRNLRQNPSIDILNISHGKITKDEVILRVRFTEDFSEGVQDDP